MVFKPIAYVLIAQAAIISFSANSATVTHNLTGTVVTPGDFFGETGIGSFSYDDAVIKGPGSQSIDAFSSLSIDLTIFGQTFTESDDIGGSARLKFNDGEPIHLDFLIAELPDPPGFNTVAIDEPGVIAIDIFEPASGNLRPVTGGFEFDIKVEAVPIPAAVWLFGSGLIGLIGVARRKKA